jgi:hypothetical protein
MLYRVWQWGKIQHSRHSSSTCYPLANKVVKGYSNATVRSSITISPSNSFQSYLCTCFKHKFDSLLLTLIFPSGYNEDNKGNAKRGVFPRLKIWPGDLDLWPWKSIGFHILLRTKYVPSLVKIHWGMLILDNTPWSIHFVQGYVISAKILKYLMPFQPWNWYRENYSIVQSQTRNINKLH